MKRNFKTLAGMAVCALGVFVTSSCTKDEFFGLEDSVVIDASTKYEIAMSQEYADYALACFEMTKGMNQQADTTSMKKAGEYEGKPIYIKEEGISTSAMVLFEVLKKTYPELVNADKSDYNDILNLALSNNEALKEMASEIAPKTKAQSSWGCFAWAQGMGHWGSSFGYEGWWITCYTLGMNAVQDAIYWAAESYNSTSWAAGIGWNDGTSASMLGSYGSWWPSIINTGSPQPESDFIVVPFDSYLAESSGPDIGELIFMAGPEYAEGNRLHYILTYEGGDYGNRLDPTNYYSYCFYY